MQIRPLIVFFGISLTLTLWNGTAHAQTNSAFRQPVIPHTTITPPRPAVVTPNVRATLPANVHPTPTTPRPQPPASSSPAVNTRSTQGLTPQRGANIPATKSNGTFVLKSGGSDGGLCSFLSQPLIDFESDPPCPFCSFEAQANSPEGSRAGVKNSPVDDASVLAIVDPGNSHQILALPPPDFVAATAATGSGYGRLVVQGRSQASFSIDLPQPIQTMVSMKLRLVKVYIPSAVGSLVNFHVTLSLNDAPQELFEQQCREIGRYSDNPDSLTIPPDRLPAVALCNYSTQGPFDASQGLRNLKITLSNNSMLTDWFRSVPFYPFAYLSIDDISFENTPKSPLSLRLGKEQVILFPPSDACGLNDDISAWQIFRKNRETDQPVMITSAGGISNADFQRGFIDLRFDATTNPSYAVKPIRGGQVGQLSNFSATSWPSALPKVTLDHSPLPDQPTHLNVGWVKTSSQRSSNIYQTDPIADRIFGISSQLWRTSDASTVGFAASQSGQPFRSTLSGPDAFLSLNNFSESVTQQEFWVVGGDLATKPLTDSQRQSVLRLLDILKPTKNLSSCSFEGNQFVCLSTDLQNETPALKISFPTLQTPLMTALKNLYFDPQDNSGLLASQQWRRWADDHTNLILPNIDLRNMTNLAALGSDAATLNAYALGFATRDAAEMVHRDKLYAISAADPNGRCLFQTGCSYHLDWIPYFDQAFIQRYLNPFLEDMANRNASLVEPDLTAFTNGFSNIMDITYAPTVQKLEALQTTNPQLAAVIDNSSIVIPDEFAGVGSSAGDNQQQKAAWRNVYKPFLSKLAFHVMRSPNGQATRAVYATAKGWIYNWINLLSTLGTEHLCLTSTRMGRRYDLDMCDAVRTSNQDFLTNLENTLSQPLDLSDIEPEAIGFAVGASGLADAVLGVANAGVGIAEILARPSVRLVLAVSNPAKTYVVEALQIAEATTGSNTVVRTAITATNEATVTTNVLSITPETRLARALGSKIDAANTGGRGEGRLLTLVKKDGLAKSVFTEGGGTHSELIKETPLGDNLEKAGVTEQEVRTKGNGEYEVQSTHADGDNTYRYNPPPERIIPMDPTAATFSQVNCKNLIGPVEELKRTDKLTPVFVVQLESGQKVFFDTSRVVFARMFDLRQIPVVIFRESESVPEILAWEYADLVTSGDIRALAKQGIQWEKGRPPSTWREALKLRTIHNGYPLEGSPNLPRIRQPDAHIPFLEGLNLDHHPYRTPLN